MDERPPGTLLARLRGAFRTRHYSPRTADAYAGWVKRFVRFHGMRHPTELGNGGVAAFLTWLADQRQVSASTQTQAASALLFLYRDVLGRDLGQLDGVLRARQPHRLPVVLTRDEVDSVIAALHGTSRLVSALLYGSGL